LLKSIGADKVFDYTKEDFTLTGETYDIIFDAVGKTSYSCSKKSLKKKGAFLSVKGSATIKNEDLVFLRELIEPGKLADIIAVSGDPLKDIKDTREIKLVIKDGKPLVSRISN
jgi:hypothetical protein